MGGSAAGGFFQTPQGEVIEVPPSAVPAYAVAEGYLPATPKQIADFKMEAKFGGAGQGALAALEAGARAATLGLSTALERGLGVPAEDIAGREKVHPVPSFLGTAGGILGPLIAGGGAGVAGLLARGTAPPALARLGRGVTATVAEALPPATTVLGKTAVRATAVGAGGVAEAGAYGLGQVVHEAALGDPKLTAESAMATIGLTAALGGALGGIVGSGEVALGAALRKARDAAQALVTKARGAYPAVAEGLGVADAETVAGLIARNAAPMSSEQRGVLAGVVSEAMQAQNEAVDAALRLANRSIQPGTSEHLINLAWVKPTAARGELSRIAGRLTELANEMQAKPDLYPKMYYAKLEEIRNGMMRDAARGGARDVFRAIDEAKQKLDPMARFRALTAPEHRDAIYNVIRPLRHDLRMSLENAELWGEAAAQKGAFNAAQSTYLEAVKDFNREFGRRIGEGHQVAASKVSSWLHQLGDPRGKLRSEVLDDLVIAQRRLVDQIEATNQVSPTAKWNRAGVDSVVNETGNVVQAARQRARDAAVLGSMTGAAPSLGGVALEIGAGHVVGGPVGAALGAAHTVYRFLSDVPKSVAALGALQRMVSQVDKQIAAGASVLVRGGKLVERAAAPVADLALYAKRTSELTRLASNPDAMLSVLERQAAAIHGHAPRTSQALGILSARAVAFLASKVPRETRAGPLAPDPGRSLTEVARYGRYLEAVERPQVLLEQARRGTLTRETVEAVAAVYPALFAKMQSAVVDAIAKRPEGIPHQQRQMISMVLGQDVDGTLRLLPRVQAIYAKQGGVVQSIKPMTAASGAAERSMTDMQKAASRGGR